MPHAEADIEALAGSIAAKGVLQAPVVEPELDADGAPTGVYFVTIGEGRRKALALLAKRKVIKKTGAVRCVLDLSNDPHEISLDENVTRSAMHPADQFEAFARLAKERGLSAEEIGARFGVSAQIVRQRLRLGAASPTLMALYRDGEFNLDQMMAFAVSEDHARQEQVLEQLGAHRPPYLIKRLMTEANMEAHDRRAIFIGAEAYQEAEGTILRDLFTEDGGGWFEDVALLDRLTTEKLESIAAEVQAKEGWKWAEARLDYPHADGLARVYPHAVERPAEQAAEIAKLSEAYDALVSQWDAVDWLPPEVSARFAEIDAALEAYGDGTAFEPEEIARGGVFVILGQDGVARVERGFVRAEDLPLIEPAAESPGAEGEGEGGCGSTVEREVQPEAEEDEGTGALSERLVLDLTAHRTAALRDALASHPEVALAAVVHPLAVSTFYPSYERASCLEVKTISTPLESHAPDVAESPAGRGLAERHARWASRLPRAASEAWSYIEGLSASELLELLAHCASLTLNAVRLVWDRRPNAWAQADRLAEATGLDMVAYWSPTVANYLGRVTKARIIEAVSEGVSAEAAERISGLKKPEMAAQAAALLVGKGWLPQLLRTPRSVPVEAEADVTAVSQEAA